MASHLQAGANSTRRIFARLRTQLIFRGRRRAGKRSFNKWAAQPGNCSASRRCIPRFRAIAPLSNDRPQFCSAKCNSIEMQPQPSILCHTGTVASRSPCGARPPPVLAAASPPRGYPSNRSAAAFFLTSTKSRTLLVAMKVGRPRQTPSQVPPGTPPQGGHRIPLHISVSAGHTPGTRSATPGLPRGRRCR
jgi:hypothetical protein